MELVAFDTETGLITRQEPTPPLVSAAFAWEGGLELLHHSDHALEDLMEELLRYHILTMWYAPYDMAIVGNTWPRFVPLIFNAYAEGRILCGRVRERTLDIAYARGTKRKYDLGAAAARRLGVDVDKDDPWRRRFIELYDVPIRRWPRAARDYAQDDVKYLLQMHLDQEREAQETYQEDGEDLLIDETNQTRADWALALQSYFGIVTRRAAVKALDAELVRKFEKAKRRLQKAKIVRPDGSRDMKAASELARRAGMKHKTSKGYSLAENYIKDLKLPDDHLLLEYQRYGSIMTTRSRLVSKLDTPLLTPRYEVLVDTGRTSASDPPVQQLPREGGFRECLGADDGNVLIVSDYKGAELVTHAQDCIDLFPGKTCKLAEVLNAGEDPHGYLGADVAKQPYHRFMKNLAHGSKQAKKMRQGAKPGNFGFPVGMGITRFCQYAKDDYGVEVTENEAKLLKQLWLRRFPENKLYLKLHRDGLNGKTTDDMRYANGRLMIKQLWSGRWRGGCSYTEACNTRFQGRAADGGKLSMWYIAWRQWMEPDSDLYGTRQVLFVHDENVIEAPEGFAEAARLELDTVMIEAFEEVCPNMKVRTDSHITDRYSKG